MYFQFGVFLFKVFFSDMKYTVFCVKAYSFYQSARFSTTSLTHFSHLIIVINLCKQVTISVSIVITFKVLILKSCL